MRNMKTFGLIMMLGGMIGVGVDAWGEKGEGGKDLLRHQVDPLNMSLVRAKFLRAAGVDMELSAEEFKADQEKGKGFAMKYDKWGTLVKYDANKNKTLDWFEVKRYRKGFRASVMGKYDLNKNMRLTGIEREKAHKALTGGELPEVVVGKRPEQLVDTRVKEKVTVIEVSKLPVYRDPSSNNQPRDSFITPVNNTSRVKVIDLNGNEREQLVWHIQSGKQEKIKVVNASYDLPKNKKWVRRGAGYVKTTMINTNDTVVNSVDMINMKLTDSFTTVDIKHAKPMIIQLDEQAIEEIKHQHELKAIRKQEMKLMGAVERANVIRGKVIQRKLQGN